MLIPKRTPCSGEFGSIEKLPPVRPLLLVNSRATLPSLAKVGHLSQNSTVIAELAERFSAAVAVSLEPSKLTDLSGSFAKAPAPPRVGLPDAVAVWAPITSAKLVPVVSPRLQ